MTPEDIAALPYRPCVGLVVQNAAGLVFAAQRNDRHRDNWQMPQGGIDPGEDVQVAGLREMGEEIGLPPDAVEIVAESATWHPYDLPHELVPQLWKGRYKGQEQKWLLLRYDGPDEAINIETEEPEFQAWQWMTPDAILESIVVFKRDVYRAVFEEFGLIASG